MKRITFVVEEFAPGTPAQQLLDRFLLGYPRDGAFHQMDDWSVEAHLLSTEPDRGALEARVKEHGLSVQPELERAIAGADAVVVVGRGAGSGAQDQLVERVLNIAARGTCCFVYGVLASTAAAARSQADLADSRGVRLLAGTALAMTWQLPPLQLPREAAMKEALIVVQGSLPNGELDGLEGLLPVVGQRPGGDSGIRSIRLASGEAVWEAGQNGAWSWELLAAALSRSDSPQGDAVTDGRTEDLVGLGLVPKLARDPRAWLMEHEDDLRSSILVLDGVVADYNIALRLPDGSKRSTQLYRPPRPAQHEFSRLSAELEDFFRSGRAPWSIARSVLTSGLMESFRIESARTKQR